MGRPIKLNEEQLQQVKADYAAGLEVEALLEKYGVSRGTLYRYLRTLGTLLGRPRGRSPRREVPCRQECVGGAVGDTHVPRDPFFEAGDHEENC